MSDIERRRVKCCNDVATLPVAPDFHLAPLFRLISEPLGPTLVPLLQIPQIPETVEAS